jgi:hypothetical protein
VVVVVAVPEHAVMVTQVVVQLCVLDPETAHDTLQDGTPVALHEELEDSVVEVGEGESSGLGEDGNDPAGG